MAQLTEEQSYSDMNPQAIVNRSDGQEQFSLDFRVAPGGAQ